MADCGVRIAGSQRPPASPNIGDLRCEPPGDTFAPVADGTVLIAKKAVTAQFRPTGAIDSHSQVSPFGGADCNLQAVTDL